MPSITGTLGKTGVYSRTTEPMFIRDRTRSLNLRVKTNTSQCRTLTLNISQCQHLTLNTSQCRN